MAASISESEVDYACPVCCDIFKDPVVLLCGHSFCKHCIQEWWRQSSLQACPVCKEIFPMSQPPRNLALRNLSEHLRKERSQAASKSKELCSLHSEKLRLFCQDDQQLICLVCRDAKHHKKHNCVPINEAAEEHRAKVKIELMHLKTKLGSFEREKLECDKMASHIKLQAQNTEKAIKSEFQKLYKFLRAEEAGRIDAVRKEATLKSETMSLRIVNLTAEISSLRDKIKTTEREMKAGDLSFMTHVKSSMERSQCNLSDPVTPSGALIDEAKHIGNLLFSVWEKMKTIIQCSPVILDPNTCSITATASEHLTCLTLGTQSFDIFPNNPERLHSYDILGNEGFRSGKHSWDVEPGTFWGIGVATRPSAQRSRRIWGIYMCICSFALFEYGGNEKITRISEYYVPKKVRVQLDYDQGTLSFFDLDRKMPLHTIKHTFTETLFPYFRENVKILPVNLLVSVRKPK